MVAEGVAADELGTMPLERLEAEITTLAGQLAAAECRWLLLIAEMDRRRAWESWECRSCAHWLAWTCGLGLRAAHERVRVARALVGLPLVTAAFAAGRLSYSKVRAVTRFVTEASEAEVVDLAAHATAAQLEIIARAHGRVLDADGAERQEAGRFVRWHTDDDGTFVLSARLPPEMGAVVRQAIEAAVGLIAADGRATSGEDDPDARLAAEGRVVADEPVAARRADALVALAEAALAGEPIDRLASHRFKVVIHTDVATLGDDAAAEPAEGAGSDRGGGHLDHGPGLLVETIRRLSCDATLVAVAERDGEVVGSAQAQSIPAATRRAVEIRDQRRCRWPGCTTGKVDVHHILERSRQGSHSMDNLLLLCRHHHRAVHEGGYRIVGPPSAARFERPDGSLLRSMETPPVRSGHGSCNLSALGATVGPDTIASRSAGERLDLDHTVWALFTHQPNRSAEHHLTRAECSAEHSGGQLTR
jgi:hypothetical protein